MTMPDTTQMAGQGLVYIRKVMVEDLPRAVQEEAHDSGLDELYALHREDGERVALVGNRGLAFMLAQQNDLQAVSVH